MGARLAAVSISATLAACSGSPAAVSADGAVAEDAASMDVAALDAGFADAAPDAGPTDAASADAAPADGGLPVMRSVHHYLALGSSSTAGFGASAPDHAYVALIRADLSARSADLQALNLGAGGATIDQFLQDHDRIAGFGPDLVTILPFTDDVRTDPAQYRSGYATLLDQLGGLGAGVFFGDLRIDPQLVCGTGSGPGGCYDTADRDTLAAKNAIVAELASTRPYVIVVPVFDQNVAHPEWNAADGHPNDLGHAYLADTFLSAIHTWLMGQ